MSTIWIAAYSPSEDLPRETFKRCSLFPEVFQGSGRVRRSRNGITGAVWRHLGAGIFRQTGKVVRGRASRDSNAVTLSHVTPIPARL